MRIIAIRGGLRDEQLIKKVTLTRHMHLVGAAAHIPMDLQAPMRLTAAKVAMATGIQMRLDMMTTMKSRIDHMAAQTR